MRMFVRRKVLPLSRDIKPCFSVALSDFYT
jgi:hypothetical protein